MIWELPTSLEVNGTEREIRTDFRDVLKILVAFEDPDLEPAEKEYICLFILYVDFDQIPKEDYVAAYKAAISFIDNGIEGDKGGPRTMDWEQDAKILFPAVNHAAGCEVRSLPYLHWHTFTGYFMEIKDSVYANVLNLRQKKAKGKKLIATCEVDKSGRSLGFYTVTVTDELGTAVAKMNATCFRRG